MPGCCVGTGCGKPLAGPYFSTKFGSFCVECYEREILSGRRALAPAKPTPLICLPCSLIQGGQGKMARGLEHTPTTPEPSVAQIGDWTFDSVCEATDGCEVEHDGRCEHGHLSWLRVLGMV